MSRKSGDFSKIGKQLYVLDNFFSSGGCGKILCFSGVVSTTSLFAGSPKNRTVINKEDEPGAGPTAV